VKKTLIFITLFALLLYSNSHALEIKGPELSAKKKNLYVSFQFRFDQKQISSLKKGLPKEIVFYVDLFRSWNAWPDEFIRGLKIIRRLTADAMKKEYKASSYDGKTLDMRRFNSLDSLLAWSLSFKDLSLTNFEDLEPGRYFVKITAESKRTKIPPLISEIFFFLPSREFRISKNSDIFVWNKERLRISK